MRRVIEAGGRSRGFINGRAATLAQLREAGRAASWTSTGSTSTSRSRAPAAQRELLDGYGGLADAAAKVAERFRAWQRAPRRAASRSRPTPRPSPPSASELEWQVRELEALKLGGGRMAGADRRSTRGSRTPRA